MHILFVESGYPHPHGGGGAGTYVQVVGRELVRRGHLVSVVAGHCPSCPIESKDEGVRVYRPKFHIPFHYYIGKFSLLRQFVLIVKTIENGLQQYRYIRKLHRAAPIDVAEFAEGGNFWFGWRRPFAVIVHLHGSRYTFLKQTGRETTKGDWWHRYMELMFMQRADHITSPSQALLEIVDDEANHLRPPYSIIPYPLDLELQWERIADENDRPPRVMFAARNDPAKGADTLLAAVPLVTQQLHDVEFHFFGFRPKRDQRIPSQVIIHPFIPRSELLQWYNKVDVCIVPSLWDNSPYTVYEAMAMGKPIVASAVGGIPELVQHGETGLLVPAQNVVALSNALLQILMSPQQCRAMGAAAKERIVERTRLQENVSMRLRLFRTVIEKHKNGH